MRRAVVVSIIALTAVPAGTAMGSGQTYVSIDAGGPSLRIKPRNIHLLSNENLSGLRWSSWGGPKAQGTGTEYANSPSPGRSGVNPVRVELRDRRQCGTRRVYTTIRIRYTHGIPYVGQKRITSFPYGCPPRP